MPHRIGLPSPSPNPAPDGPQLPGLPSRRSRNKPSPGARWPNGDRRCSRLASACSAGSGWRNWPPSAMNSQPVRNQPLPASDVADRLREIAQAARDQ